MRPQRWLLLGGLLLAGCRTADPALFPPQAGEPRADVIVLDNHWHTALIVRTLDLPADFRRQLGPTALADFVAIGWGDEGFFRAEHVTPALVFQALFASRGSVMLVFGFDGEPEAAFERTVSIYRVPTTTRSASQVMATALATFRRTGDGRLVDAGPGIDQGEFYGANGRYSWDHTCNQWTAECLAAGGLPVSPTFAATAAGIETQLRSLPGVRRDGLTVPPPRPTDRAARRLARGGRP